MRDPRVNTASNWNRRTRILLLGLAAVVLFAQRQVSGTGEAGRVAAFRQLPQEESFGRWRPIGPSSFGGKVYDLAIDARDERLIYAAYGAGGEIGSENGAGLWVTRDGGDTWRQAVDWLENSAFLSVRAHPTIAGYVAAGLRAVNYNSARGVLISKDGGTTWKNIRPAAMPADQHVWDLVFDPRNAATLYAATQGGLWITKDSGESWQQLLSYQPAPGGDFFDDAASIAISPSGAVLLLAARGAGGVQRSADGGKSWTKVDASWGGQ